MVINVRGVDVPLVTTLRVAYEFQGKFNNKPYTEIFGQIGTMRLEDQIKLVYIAYKLGAKEEAITPVSEKEFLDWALDNVDLNTLMRYVQVIILGISGRSDTAIETEGNQKAGQ